MDIHIPRFNDECQGFAFVCFKNEKNVAYLLKVDHGIVIRDRKVTVARARRDGSSTLTIVG